MFTDLLHIASCLELKKFESWIFDEILPQINHTGGYVSNEDMFIENYLPFLEEPYRNLFRLQMTAIKKS